jgi:hypothetical protein
MFNAQILSGGEILAKFKVTDNEVELLEGSEDAIATYLMDQEASGKTKEEFLRHYSTGLTNTVFLQEGTGLHILSDEISNESPKP